MDVPGEIELWPDELYVPHVVPQENRNRTYVRWMALTNDDTTGILAVGLPLLNVSAHNYTTQDLTQARHTYELEKREDIIFNLDYAQSGLGGASCGPGTLPQYLIQPEPVQFSLRLRALGSGSNLPMQLSKQVLDRPRGKR